MSGTRHDIDSHANNYGQLGLGPGQRDWPKVTALADLPLVCDGPLPVTQGVVDRLVNDYVYLTLDDQSRGAEAMAYAGSVTVVEGGEGS